MDIVDSTSTDFRNVLQKTLERMSCTTDARSSCKYRENPAVATHRIDNWWTPSSLLIIFKQFPWLNTADATAVMLMMIISKCSLLQKVGTVTAHIVSDVAVGFRKLRVNLSQVDVSIQSDYFQIFTWVELRTSLKLPQKKAMSFIHDKISSVRS